MFKTIERGMDNLLKEERQTNEFKKELIYLKNGYSEILLKTYQKMNEKTKKYEKE